MSSEPFIPRIATGVLLGSYDPFSDNNNASSSSSSRGESHVICGVCCDTRRGVIIVNSITIVLHFIMLISVFIGFGFLSQNSDTILDEMDDDVAKNTFEDWAANGNMKTMEIIVSILLIASMTMHGCGIYGAFQFELWGVITATVSYGISLLLGLISLNFIHVLVAGFFLYPHIIMIKEMQDGIMTESNYDEGVCCCCEA